MNILQKIKREIDFFGVPKERRLYYHLQKIVSDKTNFNVNKNDVIEAEKTNKLENQFNRFIFKYKGKTFKLLDDELTMLDN